MQTLAAIFLSALVLGAAPQGELLNFTATYCGPCQQMAPTIDRLQRSGYPIRKIDIQKSPDIARQYGITNIPAFVLVVNGKVVDRQIGLQSEAGLLGLLGRIPQPPQAPAAPVAPPSFAPPPTQSGPLRTAPPPPDSDAPLFVNRGPNRAGVSAAPSLTVVPNRGQATSTTKPNADLVGLKTKPEGTRSGIFNWNFGGQKPAETEAKILNTPATYRGNIDDTARPFPVRVGQSQPMAASVRIRVTDKSGTNYGSGTIIDSREGQSLVLSCGHIFRDIPEDALIEVDIFLTRERKETFVAKLIRFDNTADLGLISIPTDMLVPSVKVAGASYTLTEKDAVSSIGCGSGLEPKVEYHEVLMLNRYTGTSNLQCTGSPAQGRSGGGLFTKDRQLVGVCWAQDPHYKCGLYGSLTAVHRFLDQCELAHLYRTETEAATQLAVDVESRPSGIERLKAALGDTADEEVICIIRSSKTAAQGSRVVILPPAIHE